MFFQPFQELIVFGQTVFLLWAPGVKDHFYVWVAFLDHDCRRLSSSSSSSSWFWAAYCGLFPGVEEEEEEEETAATLRRLLLTLVLFCFVGGLD